MGFSFFPASKPPTPSGGWIFGGGFGRYWGGHNWKRIFEKTRVGFGRTELSLRLSCTEFRALSFGHGPRGLGFYGGSSGVDFCIFLLGGTGGSKVTTVKRILIKTRLSLMLSCTEFRALSSGHGPRGRCFYGGSSGADFCICWVFRKVAAKCPENKQKSD